MRDRRGGKAAAALNKIFIVDGVNHRNCLQIRSPDNFLSPKTVCSPTLRHHWTLAGLFGRSKQVITYKERREEGLLSAGSQTRIKRREDS